MSACRSIPVGLLGLVLLAGCTHGPRPVREIQEVRRRIVPSDGQLIRTSQPVQNGFSIRTQWEIQTGVAGNQIYFQWLKNQLGPEYRVTAETASTISLVKCQDGDSFVLQISGKPKPPGMVAEVDFVALPD